MSSNQILNKLLALEHARQQIGVPEPSLLELALQKNPGVVIIPAERKEDSRCSDTRE